MMTHRKRTTHKENTTMGSHAARFIIKGIFALIIGVYIAVLSTLFF